MTLRWVFVAIIAMIVGAGGLAAQNGQDLFTFDASDEAGRWSILPAADGGSQSKAFGTSNGTLRFLGGISPSKPGAFAMAHAGGLNVDLGGYDGIELRVRGDGKRYRLSLSSSPSAHTPGAYATFSTVNNEWIVVRLPLSSFVPLGRNVFHAPSLDPRHILSIGLLIADEQVGRFDVEVDWIRPYPARR